MILLHQRGRTYQGTQLLLIARESINLPKHMKKQNLSMTELKHQSTQYVRNCLVQALIGLLSEKPLSNITVTELTSAACVSRMSYYRNYKSMDEILQSYLDDIIVSYRQDVLSWPDRGNYNDYQNMLHCYEYFHKHADFVRGLLKCGMGDALLKALTDYMLDTYYQEEKGIAHYYTLLAFAGSLYNIYISWIKNDTKESAQEMASMICALYR